MSTTQGGFEHSLLQILDSLPLYGGDRRLTNHLPNTKKNSKATRINKQNSRNKSINKKSCFAFLPSHLTNEQQMLSILQSNNDGKQNDDVGSVYHDMQSTVAVQVVRLRYTTTSLDVKTCYLGWSVGSSSNVKDEIEIPAKFASFLELEEGQQVDVDILKNVNILKSKSIFVEPYTIDDYEIVEKNQMNIEEQFMNQLRVVYEGLIFPLWIHPNVFIYMKVSSIPNDEKKQMIPSGNLDSNVKGNTPYILGSDNEIIVKPMSRKTDKYIQDQSNTIEKIRSYIPVKLFPIEYAIPSENNIDSNDRSIFVSRKFAKRYGYINDDLVEVLHTVFFRINPSQQDKMDPQKSSNPLIQMKEFEEKKENRIVYARIKVLTNDNEFGDAVFIPEVLKIQLSAHFFAHAYLRIIEQEKLKSMNCSVQFLHIRQIIKESASHDEDYQDQTEDQMYICTLGSENIRNQLFKLCEANSIPLMQKNIMTFRYNGDHKLKCIVSVNEYIESNSQNEEGEDAELFNYFATPLKPVITQYGILPAKVNRNLYLLDANTVKNGIKNIVLQSKPLILKLERKDPYYFENQDELLKKKSKKLKSLKLALQKLNLLFRSQYNFSIRNKMKAFNVVITGSSGFGKSTLGKSLVKYARTSYSVIVEASSIAGDKPDVAMSKLKSMIMEAILHQPSIIFIDDLDLICPFEQEEMAPDVNVRVITSVFVNLISQAQLQRRVSLIVSCKNFDNVHKIIQDSGLFSGSNDGMIQLQVPDTEERKEVIRRLLETKEELIHSQMLFDDNIRDYIVRKTENFSPADLYNILLRMLNRKAMQQFLHSEMADEKSSILKTEDCDNALMDYTTQTTEGVKLVKNSTVAFEDIGGLEDVKRVIRETFEFPTKYSYLFEDAPIKLRSGLLLYGPPGCGKTYIALAVANLMKQGSSGSGLNFISVKGPELLNKYIGASEQAVRDAFLQAEAAKPCILFFDEFDSIAAKRGHDNTGVTDRVVNQFLCQLDGVESRNGVYVLAATSRPDLIDAALLRPGRLDKLLYCGLPSEEEREQILKVLSRKITVDDNLDWKQVAKETEGYSGADLQALMYTATILAANERSEKKPLEKNKLENDKEFHFSIINEKKVVRDWHMSQMDRDEHTVKIKKVLENVQANAAFSKSEGMCGNEETTTEKLVITMDHLKNSLTQTKASLTQKERAQYDYIYSSFLHTRSGKQPSTSNSTDFKQKRVTLA